MIRVHSRQIYFYLIFAWVFRTSCPKMGVLGGKIGERVVRYWPPTNSFLLFGVLTSVPIFVKIDQEMRPWECSQTDRQTDTHTHTHTQTQTDFIICPMLYAIAMGQIIMRCKSESSRRGVEVDEGWEVCRRTSLRYTVCYSSNYCWSSNRDWQLTFHIIHVSLLASDAEQLMK